MFPIQLWPWLWLVDESMRWRINVLTTHLSISNIFKNWVKLQYLKWICPKILVYKDLLQTYLFGVCAIYFDLKVLRFQDISFQKILKLPEIPGNTWHDLSIHKFQRFQVVLTFQQIVRNNFQGTEIVTCPARCSRRLAFEKARPKTGFFFHVFPEA